MEKINSDERAKAIIKAFKQLSVEEMEKLLIKLGIPFVEFLGELMIPGNQIIQIVDKVTDLLEVSIDNVVFEALIDESEQIMKVFDEEEDGQPLS